MQQPEDREKYIDLLIARTKVLRNLVILLALGLVVLLLPSEKMQFPPEPALPVIGEITAGETDIGGAIVDGIHQPTGLIATDGFEVVAIQCGNCHSLKLVTQNKANREGWKSIIEWMQKTQNLWDLGEQEATILDYLAKNYAPEEKGRRQNLTNIEWYELETN